MGGDVTIHARSLSIDGLGNANGAQELPQTRPLFREIPVTGDAGNLTVMVDKLLSIAGSGQIWHNVFLW
jgi:hypothetical protein